MTQPEAQPASPATAPPLRGPWHPGDPQGGDSRPEDILRWDRERAAEATQSVLGAVLVARSALLKAAHRVWLALNGDGRDADAESEYADELLALAARDLTRAVDRVPARDQPVGWRGEQAVTSLILTTPTPAPPKMPPGIYGRAELPGFRSHVGWATDGVIGGQPCIVMSDRDGTVLGEYILGPASRFVRLEVPDVNAPSAVPRGVQDQVERQAITQDGTWYDDGWPDDDDDKGPF